MIAPMAGDVARGAFLLDVPQLALGGQLPIAADHASACERSKPEEPYKTHMATKSSRVPRGRASHMPLSCRELPESLDAVKSVFTRLSACLGQNARAIPAGAICEDWIRVQRLGAAAGGTGRSARTFLNISSSFPR